MLAFPSSILKLIIVLLFFISLVVTFIISPSTFTFVVLSFISEIETNLLLKVDTFPIINPLDCSTSICLSSCETSPSGETETTGAFAFSSASFLAISCKCIIASCSWAFKYLSYSSLLFWGSSWKLTLNLLLYKL